jgi:Lar family restriction alleviation protein
MESQLDLVINELNYRESFDEQLSKCPYCGKLHQFTGVVVSYINEKKVFSVECGDDKCYAAGPIAETESEAISKWNTRWIPRR